MQSVSGCRGLYARPTYPDAVKWSDDNLLAVASGPSVVICSVSDLSGPRSFTNCAVQDLPHLLADKIPDDHASNLHFHLRNVAGFSATPKGPPSSLAVRSLEWSSLGCTATGGCLLATITEDHKVSCLAATLCPQ